VPELAIYTFGKTEEQAIERALAQGEYKTFNSMEDMLDFLEKRPTNNPS